MRLHCSCVTFFAETGGCLVIGNVSLELMLSCFVFFFSLADLRVVGAGAKPVTATVTKDHATAILLLSCWKDCHVWHFLREFSFSRYHGLSLHDGLVDCDL